MRVLILFTVFKFACTVPSTRMCGLLWKGPVIRSAVNRLSDFSLALLCVDRLMLSQTSVGM